MRAEAGKLPETTDLNLDHLCLTLYPEKQAP